jgi:hypothetical protein
LAKKSPTVSIAKMQSNLGIKNASAPAEQIDLAARLCRIAS